MGLSSWLIFRGLGRGELQTNTRDLLAFLQKKINAKPKELDFNFCPRADEVSLPHGLHSLYIVSLSSSNCELRKFCENIFFLFSMINQDLFKDRVSELALKSWAEFD